MIGIKGATKARAEERRVSADALRLPRSPPIGQLFFPDSMPIGVLFSCKATSSRSSFCHPFKSNKSASVHVPIFAMDTPCPKEYNYGKE